MGNPDQWSLTIWIVWCQCIFPWRLVLTICAILQLCWINTLLCSRPKDYNFLKYDVIKSIFFQQHNYFCHCFSCGQRKLPLYGRYIGKKSQKKKKPLVSQALPSFLCPQIPTDQTETSLGAHMKKKFFFTLESSSVIWLIVFKLLWCGLRNTTKKREAGMRLRKITDTCAPSYQALGKRCKHIFG